MEQELWHFQKISVLLTGTAVAQFKNIKIPYLSEVLFTQHDCVFLQAKNKRKYTKHQFLALTVKDITQQLKVCIKRLRIIIVRNYQARSF